MVRLLLPTVMYDLGLCTPCTVSHPFGKSDLTDIRWQPIGIHSAMNIEYTNKLGVGLNVWSYIILTRGMGKPMYYGFLSHFGERLVRPLYQRFFH